MDSATIWSWIGALGAMATGIAALLGVFRRPIGRFTAWLISLIGSAPDGADLVRQEISKKSVIAVTVAIGVLLNGLGVFIGATKGLWVWLAASIGVGTGTVAPPPRPTPKPSVVISADPCAPYLRQPRGNDLEGVWSGVGWSGGDETIVVKGRDVTATGGGTGNWLRRGSYLYWTDSDGYKFKARIFGETVCGTRANAKGAPRGVFVLHREKPATPAIPEPAIETNMAR